MSIVEGPLIRPICTVAHIIIIGLLRTYSCRHYNIMPMECSTHVRVLCGEVLTVAQ